MRLTTNKQRSRFLKWTLALTSATILAVAAQAQQASWDQVRGQLHIDATAGSEFETTSAVVEEVTMLYKMTHLNLNTLFAPQSDQRVKIITDDPTSKYSIIVYGFDPENGGYGKILFAGSYEPLAGAAATNKMDTLVLGVDMAAGNRLDIGGGNSLSLPSASVKHNVQVTAPYVGMDVRCKLPVSMFDLLLYKYNLSDDEDLAECFAQGSRSQPVIVKLKVSSSQQNRINVQGIYVPGIGLLNPLEMFPAYEMVCPLSFSDAIIAPGADARWNVAFNIIKNLPGRWEIQKSSVSIIDMETHATIYSIAIPAPILLPHDQTFVSQAAISDQFYQGLKTGSYGVVYDYDAVSPGTGAPGFKGSQLLTFFRRTDSAQITTFNVVKHDYEGLSVFALRGGMSAEYALQKSLSLLAGGISHTWDVRTKLNGELDLAGGGPVSVYSSPDFLNLSVKRAIELYDENLGKDTPYETVIIGTGIASAPYMSYYLRAPFLPLHFLTASRTLAEVKMMVDRANKTGYKCYATAGYDPSIEKEGVAWLKLLDIPVEYIDFLRRHKVKNVIFLGLKEHSAGESLSTRLMMANDAPVKYAPGAVYLMRFGSDEWLKDAFNDIAHYAKEDFIDIADWESGIANVQMQTFSKSIETNLNDICSWSMTSDDGAAFYDNLIDFTLRFKEINKDHAFAIETPRALALNEYLIGYPAYEFIFGQLPFLYWQSSYMDKANVKRITGPIHDKVLAQYPNINYNKLEFHFNAKYDRSSLKNALQEEGYTNVTMDPWQKADVWNTVDGMNAPCELVAKKIVDFGRMEGTNWQDVVTNYIPLTPTVISSMSKMVAPEDNRAGADFPEPSTITDVAAWSGDGIAIKSYRWNANPYWQTSRTRKYVEWVDLSTPFPGTSKGWLDLSVTKGKPRSQRVIITEFDLTNASDEMELKMAYKFHPTPADGFNTYDPALGDEQNMGCFEYVKVPRTSWLDIPSRVMAREGALWITNGSVYDWDYNGIPGVVPFIKKRDVVKARPQILSYKGEAAFSWSWGRSKRVSLIGRPKELPANGLVTSISTLFQNETRDFPNTLAGMTFMHNGRPYNVNELQPQWMLDYPPFAPEYMGPSGTSIRCFLAAPGGINGPCRFFLEAGAKAPTEEGWNNCGRLNSDEAVQRYSTLAYRQYTKLFDDFPNARTYVALKGNKLDIGIIDGDLGQYGELGPILTKQWGMCNWEVSNFYLHKNYDKLMNLDGGSSSQLWLNGRGPLHDWTGYPLVEDNQGPYFSRLVSTFVMIVPKIHTDEARAFSTDNKQYLELDNTAISLDYDDEEDIHSDKAYISLAPSLDEVTGVGLPADDRKGAAIACNFRLAAPTSNEAGHGSVLFSVVEETYYPDTEGLFEVIPVFRNFSVAGFGKIPGRLKEAILKDTKGDQDFAAAMQVNIQAFYYIAARNGIITDYCFYAAFGNTHYFDNQWHSLVFKKQSATDYLLMIDKLDLTHELISAWTNDSPLDVPFANDAMIGAINVDGRFITGNAKLDVDNFVIVNKKEAMDRISSDRLAVISDALTLHNNLPQNFTDLLELGAYAFQFEERAGLHSFRTKSSNDSGLGMYGLNLNGSRKKYGEGGGGGENVDRTTTSLRVHPNPTNGEINIRLTTGETGNAHVEILDLDGNRHYSGSIAVKAGKGHLTLTSASQSIRAGVYLVKVTHNEKIYTERIVVNGE